MNAAKSYVAGATAFLAFVATKNVALGWAVEAILVASIAAVTVYIVPNRD